MATVGGQPGNQNARKAKAWSEAIRRALARYSGQSVDAGLDRLADRMVKAAMEENDNAAATMIMEKIGDRLEGKPAQAIIGGDGDDPPVKVEGVLKLVRAKAQEEGE